MLKPLLLSFAGALALATGIAAALRGAPVTPCLLLSLSGLILLVISVSDWAWTLPENPDNDGDRYPQGYPRA
jgi:hypothetical protein